MDDETRDRIPKLSVCYMTGKGSVLFAKYPALLELGSRYGVGLGPVYHVPDLVKSFSRLEQCMVTFANSSKRLKSVLELSDIKLLSLWKAQSWQKGFSEGNKDNVLDQDDIAEVTAAVKYSISTFCIPLKAKRMCVTSVQDEVKDVVS